MQARLFHLHCLSALHCGTGQSAGVVDLPIARARASGLPIAPGSSLRGVLREDISARDPKRARTLFGPETVTGTGDACAGACAIGDAHLLLLPVRSLAGILCFATCPYILTRYATDRARAGLPQPPLPARPPTDAAWVTAGSANSVNQQLVLEDLDLPAVSNPQVQGWAELLAQTVHPLDAAAQTDLCDRIALLPDDLFGFLAETATEVRARIAINPKTGTVKRGALWYEENLPAETLLWGVYALEPSRNPDDPQAADALASLLPGAGRAEGALLQLGGKAGVGRGLVRFLAQEDAP